MLVRGATVATRASADHSATNKKQQRDPLKTLTGCERILILGRTGSGKTTLARELAAALGVPHVELDSLYFGPDFSRAPLSLLRERTSAAIAGDRWVTDGNKRAVRDLVWPRADTIIWLDYPAYMSFWRLAKTCAYPYLGRSARRPLRPVEGTGLPKQMLAAGERELLTALRSHRDSAGNTRLCSPSRRTSISLWHALAFTPCYSSMDGSRQRVAPPARVGASGCRSARLSDAYCCFPATEQPDGSRAKGL
jgi:hypothetical protein